MRSLDRHAHPAARARLVVQRTTRRPGRGVGSLARRTGGFKIGAAIVVLERPI
jgi:hypothetical protein